MRNVSRETFCMKKNEIVMKKDVSRETFLWNSPEWGAIIGK